MEQTEKPTERALNVVQLKPNDQASYPQHDLQLMGKRIQLDVDALMDGYRLQYYCEMEIDLPEPFASIMTGDKKKKINSLVSTLVVRPKWFDRLLGITLEKRLVSSLARMKKDLLKVQYNYEQLGKALKH